MFAFLCTWGQNHCILLTLGIVLKSKQKLNRFHSISHNTNSGTPWIFINFGHGMPCQLFNTWPQGSCFAGREIVLPSTGKPALKRGTWIHFTNATREKNNHRSLKHLQCYHPISNDLGTINSPTTPWVSVKILREVWLVETQQGAFSSGQALFHRFVHFSSPDHWNKIDSMSW